MDIKADEITNIEEAGMLDKKPVKMLRTKGGFWIAVGQPKGKYKEEALSVGSHPAIVKFNLEKQYPGFEPALMKSEIYNDSAIVEKHSHFLSEELRKSGHDIYSVQDGSNVEFYVTKMNSQIASVNGILEKNTLVFKELKMPKELARALAGAATEKAISCNAPKIRIEE